MMFTCASCPKDFRTGASLNFHTKKVHGENSSTSSRRDAQECESNALRRSARLRPVMLKFGKIPGMRDFTKGPFKVSRVALKIIEDREDGRAKSRRPSSRNSIALSTAETELVNVPEVNNTDNRKKALITEKSEAVSASADLKEKESSTPMSTPSSTDRTYSEMPVLTPQSTPVLAPEKVASRGRPGPKRSKKGTHGKFNDQDDAVPSKKTDTPSTPPPSRRKVRHGEDAMSAVSGSSASQKTSTPGISTLETATSKETEKESRSNKNTLSPRSRASSVSRENGENPTSPPSSNDEIQPGSSKPRPFFSGKSQQCQICGKTGFRTPNHYVNHLEVHEGKRPYLCPYPKCDMGYETDIKLLEHVTIRHSQEAAFTCLNCGQEYRTQKGLNNHKCIKKQE